MLAEHGASSGNGLSASRSSVHVSYAQSDQLPTGKCAVVVQITFAEKGDEHPGREAADIIFQIDEKPHATFKREGNDLVSSGCQLGCGPLMCCPATSDHGREPFWAQPGKRLRMRRCVLHCLTSHCACPQVYTHRLPLVDALSGTTVQLQHLDGSPIKVPVDEVGGVLGVCAGNRCSPQQHL